MQFITGLHLYENPPHKPAPLWGEGLLLQQTMGMLHAPAKLGKSFASLNLAFAGALECAQREFLGFPLRPEPFKTVYFQNEIALFGVHERLAGMAKHLVASGKATEEQVRAAMGRILINKERTERLSVDSVFLAFTQFLKEERPELVILDPVAHVLTDDENNNTIVGQVLQRIATWRDDPGCAVLYIHHNAKPSEASWGRQPHQHSRGADRFNADPDVILSLSPGLRQPCGPSAQMHVASRYGRGVDPINIRLNEETMWFERFYSRGDLELIVAWVDEAGGQMGVKNLYEKINSEWGYRDPQNRRPIEHVKHCVDRGWLERAEIGSETLVMLPRKAGA